ncbi:CHAD domain-containing protein [Thioalkalivibrio sp.]|uniref:CHAD domain-containing protein n=1 Tax=Thioalkalivibrio sp. TaxID=2093813 RepID=UPI00356246CE
MAFAFRRTESVPAGIRRVANEEMRNAEAELLDTDMPGARAVHETRKRLKRLRALLRLVEPALPGEAFRERNRVFRDLGRALSGARDAEVVLATLRTLTGDSGLPSVNRLEDYLAARNAPEPAGGQSLELQRQYVAGVLRETRAEFLALPLRRKGFALLGPGLERTYRRGREALGGAIEDPDDTRWHAWRKRVKEHWSHLRLLQPVWPEVMQSHVGALEALSDLLGDEHDLTVLSATLDGLPEGVIDTETHAGLRRQLADHKALLRHQALPLGQRLYAEKPKAMRIRLHAYWRVWRS